MEGENGCERRHKKLQTLASKPLILCLRALGKEKGKEGMEQVGIGDKSIPKVSTQMALRLR